MSAPVLIWNVMLNITKVELKLISDPDIFLFFEKEMRGGVSYISRRYSKPNNLVTQNKSQCIYLDATNLYGYAMSKFLPTNRYKWIDPKELDFHKYCCNSPKVCV